MRFLVTFFSLALFFIVNGPIAHAQINTNIVGEGVSITLDPQYPTPGETVTASIDDYSINNSGSSITWYIDDLSAPAVDNMRSVTFTAPAIGTAMKIVARLTFTDGRQIEAKKTIVPMYLDVIIEPQTYTPVFYKGRALPVHGSIVNLTALLQTIDGPVDTSKYSYTWTLNNKSVYGGARLGGNNAQITVPHGRASVLTISIQDSGGTTIMRRLVSIPSVPVDLKFYEINTLFGLSKKIISGELILTGNSTSIKAVPYYLDTRAVTGNALFTEWKINSQTVTTENLDPFEINLKRGVSGRANVGFKLRNLNELLQSDESSFSVQF
jgi:hypothetical protein